MSGISLTSISMTSNLSVSITLMDSFNNKVDELISGVDKLINGVSELNSSFTGIDETMKEICDLQSQLLKKESNTTNVLHQEISLTNVLSQSMQNVVNVQETANASTEESGSIMGRFFGIAKNGIQAIITESMKMEDQMISVQGMLGNKEAGSAYFNHLQKQANESGFAFEDLQNNARNFLDITKNTDSLDKLGDLSERLSLGNTFKGLEDAGSAIKDMMSGDGEALKTDFGFNEDDIGILKASKDMDDFTSKFDSLLNKKGLDADMLGSFNNSATAQFDNLKSNLDTAMGTAGQGALEALTPIMGMINQMFSNGSFQIFFDEISFGLTGIANLIQWVSQLIVSGLPVIIPVLAGIITMLGIWKSSLLAVAIYQGIVNFVQGVYGIIVGQATMAQLGLNAAMYACPAVWIIGIILAIIIAIVALIACCEPVRNAFAAAFQGIAIVCSTAFGIVVDCVQNVLNWIIDKLNVLLDGINKVSTEAAILLGGTGTKWHIESVNFSDFKNTWQGRIEAMGKSGSDGIKNVNIDNIKASLTSFMGMDGKKNPEDILKEYNKNQDPDRFPMNNIGDNSALTNNVAEGANSLNNIESKIDISNEHLEMLRDLAEQDSIQNFVTLTPTVQITTGDIKEEADINKIIAHIENYMENELATSAEGVYA